MAHFFFDIETIPATSAELQSLVDSYNEIGPRMSFERYFRMTALSGDWGRILCIGYALGQNSIEILTGRENEQLERFWRLARGADLLIGHNIYQFDLPFIHRRSRFYKIEPTIDFTLQETRAKIFDTLHHFRRMTSGRADLDAAAKYFGLPSSKSNINGRLVWDYYKTERNDEIYDYCKRDVEVTREIFLRLAPITQANGERRV